MSGGVDSSVAAAMLVRAGYDVVGCFMRLGSPGETLDAMEEFDSAGIACDARNIRIGHQGCCSITDAADARMVAAELGIPFYVVNFKKDFGRIIDYFVDEYAEGRTPNPCVRCNDWLKFGKLREYAGQIGADMIASGHYARTEDGRLLRGIDRGKDQSYVLFGVPPEHLPHMLLPIGAMEKSDVRALAQQFGLPTFDKPDSQEICFVPDNDYAGLVERRRPELARGGRIVDESGRVLGEHGGQHRFTIGQRRGLGLGAREGAADVPLFVLRKEAASNSVVVAPRERLLAGACTAGEANWLVDEREFVQWRPILAKYRYNTPAVAARARAVADAAGSPKPSGRRGRFEVQFDSPQAAVAPGQAIVLYDGDIVLGGGWIESTRA